MPNWQPHQQQVDAIDSGQSVQFTEGYKPEVTEGLFISCVVNKDTIIMLQSTSSFSSILDTLSYSTA